jgi:hypothetical protein
VDRLSAHARRALDETLLLGESNYDDIASNFGVSRAFVLRAKIDLHIGESADEALDRFNALQVALRASLTEGSRPDVNALAKRFWFAASVVSRELALIKTEILALKPLDDDLVESSETLVASEERPSVAWPSVTSVFPDSPLFCRGAFSDVVFAPNPSMSKLPVREYLVKLYEVGGQMRQRALELEETIKRYAEEGVVHPDSIQNLGNVGKTSLAEFRTWKHRVYFKLVTLVDANSPDGRRTCVLLSAHEKKRDDTKPEELERAIRNYEAWVNSLTTDRRVKNMKRNPDDISYWRPLSDAEEVDLDVVRLMQDLQGVVRDAMRRDGVTVAQVAEALKTTEQRIETVLWDTSARIHDLLAVAHVLGVKLGGHEA